MQFVPVTLTCYESFFSGGTNLQCANRFGESLIHMACRRSHRDVVSFLVNEAGVSLRVRDDYGRTPFHDACWRPELDLELIQEAATVGYEVADEGMDDQSPFLGVLRSKGFCWLAPTSWSIDSWRHDTAMYWSHAGKHFGIQTAGKWWGSMTEEQMERFGSINPTEFERIKREDFVSEEWKDRRQEIVFIGVALDEDEVTKTLNDCLLNDEELERYRAEQQNFMNKLFSTGAKSTSGASLLNVGSTDHMG